LGSLILKVAESNHWCKERWLYALRTAKYENRTLGGVRGALAVISTVSRLLD